MSNKRYNFVLPQELYDEAVQIAQEKGLPLAEVLRRFVKLGINATHIEDTPDVCLVVRKDGTEREVLLYPEQHRDTKRYYIDE